MERDHQYIAFGVIGAIFWRTPPGRTYYAWKIIKIGFAKLLGEAKPRCKILWEMDKPMNGSLCGFQARTAPNSSNPSMY